MTASRDGREGKACYRAGEVWIEGDLQAPETMRCWPSSLSSPRSSRAEREGYRAAIRRRELATVSILLEASFFWFKCNLLPALPP